MVDVASAKAAMQPEIINPDFITIPRAWGAPKARNALRHWSAKVWNPVLAARLGSFPSAAFQAIPAKQFGTEPPMTDIDCVKQANCGPS